MNSKQRTRELLAHALTVAERDGWARMTREAVAMQAEVSPGLVSARLGTMAELRRAVMRAAVAAGTLRVVAEGLVLGDKHALRAPESLRAAAAASIASKQ
jgi:hypothetical protein